MTFLEWLASLNWLAISATVALPSLAILVPTIISIRLFKAARAAALDDQKVARADVREDQKVARRLDAGGNVILALAPLASLINVNRDMQPMLWDLRARIAVYRAWITPGDLSGDWLSLRHREGMRLWFQAMDEINSRGGPNRLADEEVLGFLTPAHTWAATTTEMFSGWLSGHIDTSVLSNDGARIIETYGAPEPLA